MSDSSLGRYYSINKSGIDPRFFPEEVFYYYNLPDFDTGAGVALSLGKSIDSNKFLVKPGSLLISKLNPRIRRVWLVRNDGLFRSISSTEFVNLIPNDNADVDYLLYFLQQDWLFARLDSEAVGTTNSHVRFKPDLLCKITGELPSKPEQRKVARILTTLDNLIEKTEALIAKYQAIKQGMMHDLFTRGVDEHGHLRASYAETPDLYKRSELGWIPKEWRLSCVANEFQISTGFTLGLHRRPKQNAKRYLRVANVQRDEIRLDDVAELEATDEEFESRKLEPSDMLVVEGHADPGEIGRCALVTPESAGLTFQNHLFRLRSRTVQPRFACDWLNSETARSYWFRQCATSSGLNTINQTMLKKMPCLVPQPSEQEEIATRSVAQSGSIKSMELSLFKYRQIKTGLMQDLLTGRVRVKVDDAEDVAP